MSSQQQTNAQKPPTQGVQSQQQAAVPSQPTQAVQGASSASPSSQPPIPKSEPEKEIQNSTAGSSGYQPSARQPGQHQNQGQQSGIQHQGVQIDDDQDIDNFQHILDDEDIDFDISSIKRVADMTYDEKQEELKIFYQNVWANKKIGDYIDAVDSVQKWCLGEVVNRDDNACRIHFDGWSSKWDVTQRWTSYKITPFRRYSRGYTGQVKTPLRNNMQFDIDQCRAERKFVDRLVKNDFKGLTAYELTQYLRGKLFIYVDFVMGQSSYEEVEAKEVSNLLKAVIRLVVAWLKKIPSVMQRCMTDLKKDSDLFLVDEDIALFLSSNEVMGMLKSIFCGCHRTLRYYVHFDENQQAFQNSVAKDFSSVDFVNRRTPQNQEIDVNTLCDWVIMKQRDLVFGHALNNLNYFNEIGGFTALLDLLREGNRRQPEEQDKDSKQPAKELISLEYIGDLTNAFVNSGLLMKEEFALSFVNEVEKIMNERLMGMRDKEIKELDKEILPGVLIQLNSFLSIAKPDEVNAELVEKIQLSFAERFLRTTYLEKRLKGVADLRSLIERVGARHQIERARKRANDPGSQLKQPQNYIVVAGQKIKPTKYLDRKILCQWLQTQKIPELLFGEAAHAEILKRAAPVIRFLSQEGALTNEIIDMIWKCQQGKHEETVRVVYGLIIEVADDLDIGLLEILFEKIAAVPASEHCELYLTFLKDFSQRAFEVMENIQMQQQTTATAAATRIVKAFSNLKEAVANPENASLLPGEKLYGLPVFWSILQDSYQCTDAKLRWELHAVALDSITELLGQPCARSAALFFLLSCLKNLQQGVSLYPSICLIISILGGLDALPEDEAEVPSTLKALCLLEEVIGLVSLILKDIEIYDNQVKEALKVLVRKNKSPPEKVETQVFAGCTDHQQTLKKLLELLEFVIIGSNHAVSIGADNLDTLWKTFVLSPNFTSDQVLFLSFINKSRQRPVQNYDMHHYGRTAFQEVNLLTSVEQKHLFTKILCNSTFVDYTQLSSGLSKCFHTYFRLINQEAGNLDPQNKRIEVTNFEELVGMDSLWQISFQSQNEKVRDESRELLVDLHLRLDQGYKPATKKSIMQGFIDRSMNILKDSTKDNVKGDSVLAAQSVVQVLSEFLDHYEGKKPIKPEMRPAIMQYQHFQPWTIQVICRKDQRGGQQEGRIQVSQYETMGSVRHKCARLFGLEQNEFLLRLKQGLVDPDEDDDKYVRDHGMSPQIYLLPNQNYDKKGHPKYLLAQNQDYFESLLGLLAKGGPTLVEPVWGLLEKLPVNSKLQEDLRELRDTEQGWDNLFDPHSTHKLLYSLKIVEGLLSASSNVQQDEKETDQNSWKKKFIQKGGFKHLLKTLTELKIEKIDSKLTLRCIESMITTIFDFIQVDPGLQQKVQELKNAVVPTCLRYIHLIGEFTIAVEQQRGEAVEDMQAKRQQQRLAKQQLKQLQMSSTQQNRRGAQNGNDEDSDNDADEVTEQINAILTDFTAVRRVAHKLFAFLNKFIFEQDPSAKALIAQYPSLEEMVLVTLIKTENHLIRTVTGSELKNLIIACSGEETLAPAMQRLLEVLLIKILPHAHALPKRSQAFFSMLKNVFEGITVKDLAPLEQELHKLSQKLVNDIITIKPREGGSFREETLLVGTMHTLKALMQKYPALKAEIGSKIVNYLLHDCLFQVPQASHGPGQIRGPKCKSSAARTAALQLLSVLSRDCLSNLKVVLDYLKEFSKRASWRTNKDSDWQITHLDDEKSSTGYVGLKNLGCICYMISLFQQLFAVPTFRNDLLSVNDPNHDGQEPEENMFYQLQAVFTGLLKSERQYVNPKGFCHAFKDWEGNPTNVLEQVDVEEFLTMFMDRLETAIKGSPYEKTVQHHFGGKFAGETICKGCPHSYESRNEPFLSLGVAIKNKRTVQEGLQALIAGDMLEGDNAYLCAKCDKKVDALKRTSIKELPRYMLLTLKRFEFDFDRMVRVKVNDYCEFPHELDMLPYTQEGLQRKEKEAKLRQEAAEKGEDNPEIPEEPLKHPVDYYNYKLKGVVVHSGTADSGHYYSFIKESSADAKSNTGEKWLEFNDHLVREFDPNELANECFGGEESFIGQGMAQMRTQKWRNAYIVVYERRNQTEEHTQEESEQPATPVKKEVDPSAQAGPKLSDPDHPIQQAVQLENQKYWQNKFLFGTEYFDFISEVTHYWNTANIVPLTSINKNNDGHIVGFQLKRQGLDPMTLHPDIAQPLDEVFDLSKQHQQDPSSVSETSHEVFKLATRFYLTILQRAEKKNLVPKMVNALKSYINHDSRNGAWLLEEFSNWAIVEEMLLQVNGKEMPKLTCGLLYCSMLTVYDKEKELLADYWPSDEEYARDRAATRKGEAPQIKFGKPLGPLGNFVLMLLSHLYDIKAFTRNLPHYFQLLARFASLGPEAREFLLRAKTVGRCMDFFFDEASPYREAFSDMTGLGPIRTKELPDIGLPTQVDHKMRGYGQMLAEQRRRKQLANAPAKYKYLFELVGLCVRHIKVLGTDKSTPYQLDSEYAGSPRAGPVINLMNNQESDIFIPEAKWLRCVFIEAKKNRSMMAIAKAHCHYALQDAGHDVDPKNEEEHQDNLEELFKTVERGLNDYDHDNLRPFLFLFEIMLEPNQNDFSRRAAWLGKFIEIVKRNQYFYKWMEVVFEFIFKMIDRNPKVREWFYANQQICKFLADWAGQHSRAPLPNQQQGIRLFKVRQAMQYQMHALNDPGSNARSTLAAAYRVRKLQELLSRQVVDTKDEPDPDRQDMQDFKFYPGDTVTLYSRKKDQAEQWRVTLVLDEILNLSCINSGTEGMIGQMKWQSCDSQKILFGDTYNRLRRTRLRQEILELRQAKAQQQYNMDFGDDPDDDEDGNRRGHGGGRGQGAAGQRGQGGRQGAQAEVTPEQFTGAGAGGYLHLSSDGDSKSSDEEAAN